MGTERERGNHTLVFPISLPKPVYTPEGGGERNLPQCALLVFSVLWFYEGSVLLWAGRASAQRGLGP